MPCSFHLPKRDIHCMKFLYSICAFFGVVPFYDFKQKKASSAFFKAYFPVALLLAISLGAIYGIYYQLSLTELNVNIFLAILTEILFVVLGLYQAKTSLFSKQKWAKLNNDFQYIDGMLGKQKTRKEFNINVTITFFIALFLIIWLYDVFVRIEFVGLNNYFAYVFQNLLNINSFLTNLLMAYLMVMFKARYSALLELLESKFHKQNKQTDNIYGIREIGSNYRILAEMIDVFNELFGVCYIIVAGEAVLFGLSALSYVYGFSKLDRGVLIARMVSIAHTIFNIVFTILTSHSAVDESSLIYHLCYKLQEKEPLNSRSREELLQLAEFIQAYEISISAGGFFLISKNSLLQILASISTYFILIIQLSK